MRPIGGTVGVALVRAYQILLGPFLGGGCRFTPSCSAYALQAFTQHGFWCGSWLALCRIGRCHPFAHHGVDPVPAAKNHLPSDVTATR